MTQTRSRGGLKIAVIVQADGFSANFSLHRRSSNPNEIPHNYFCQACREKSVALAQIKWSLLRCRTAYWTFDPARKLVAYEWRRRPLRPRTRLFPPGQPCTCACPPSIDSIPLTNQLDVIRQYAASHSMEIVQVYSDLRCKAPAQ